MIVVVVVSVVTVLVVDVLVVVEDTVVEDTVVEDTVVDVTVVVVAVVDGVDVAVDLAVAVADVAAVLVAVVVAVVCNDVLAVDVAVEVTVEACGHSQPPSLVITSTIRFSPATDSPHVLAVERKYPLEVQLIVDVPASHCCKMPLMRFAAASQPALPAEALNPVSALLPAHVNVSELPPHASRSPLTRTTCLAQPPPDGTT